MNVVTVNLDSFWVGFFAGAVSLLIVGVILAASNNRKIEKQALEMRRLEAAREAVEAATSAKSKRKQPPAASK
jgi:hypothetical protein